MGKREQTVENLIDHYMNLRYTMELAPDEMGYRASVKELSGCTRQPWRLQRA